MPQIKMPAVKAPWDQTGANSLKGKGKIPGGKERSVNTGKGTDPITKSSANVGMAMGDGTVSNKKGVSVKSIPQGKSPANSTKGSKPLTSLVLKKNSVTGQSQTIMKPLAKQPKASGVPVAPSNTGWHGKLGFGGVNKGDYK